MGEIVRGGRKREKERERAGLRDSERARKREREGEGVREREREREREFHTVEDIWVSHKKHKKTKNRPPSFVMCFV